MFPVNSVTYVPGCSACSCGASFRDWKLEIHGLTTVHESLDLNLDDDLLTLIEHVDSPLLRWLPVNMQVAHDLQAVHEGVVHFPWGVHALLPGSLAFETNRCSRFGATY